MPTILVADDDANIRELVCLFLHNDGFATAEAADGKEALAVYASTPLDLVVLDIMMPVMDGWALCKELRRANPDLPLLMLTARGETWEKVKGFELGTDDYLTKPFDPLELTVRVKALSLLLKSGICLKPKSNFWRLVKEGNNYKSRGATDEENTFPHTFCHAIDDAFVSCICN